jgi:hypothetical protein
LRKDATKGKKEKNKARIYSKKNKSRGQNAGKNHQLFCKNGWYKSITFD